MVATKKTAKKKVAKKKALSNQKLHVVLGDKMTDFEKACANVGAEGMSKSEVGRLLCTAFIAGDIKITPAKTSKKVIKA